MAKLKENKAVKKFCVHRWSGNNGHGCCDNHAQGSDIWGVAGMTDLVQITAKCLHPWSNNVCNWLGGTLSGPKRPIFCHPSPIFWSWRCYGLQKSASSGKKWPLFWLRRDHANSYQLILLLCPFEAVSGGKWPQKISILSTIHWAQDGHKIQYRCGIVCIFENTLSGGQLFLP